MSRSMLRERVRLLWVVPACLLSGLVVGLALGGGAALEAIRDATGFYKETP